MMKSQKKVNFETSTLHYSKFKISTTWGFNFIINSSTIYFVIFQQNLGNCPSGWVQLHKKCIQLFSISANLPTARRFCEDAGAKIFVPNEKSEIRELSDTLALFGLREEENWPWVGKGSKIRTFEKFQIFQIISKIFHSLWSKWRFLEPWKTETKKSIWPKVSSKSCRAKW